MGDIEAAVDYLMRNLVWRKKLKKADRIAARISRSIC